LRIADGFGQHLAQLRLGLRRLSRETFLQLCHFQYMGMSEAELNPRRDCQRIIHVRLTTLFLLDFAACRLPVRPNTLGILDGVSEA
jgi:hypothetical protein